MLFIKTIFLSYRDYFEYYPIGSRLSRGFLLTEVLVSLVLAAFLALWITQWSVSWIASEAQAAKRVRMVEVARRYVERLSCDKVTSLHAQEADCSVDGVVWQEPTAPLVSWIAVTVSWEGPRGKEVVTLLGSRA